jgi:hypothetical protein
MAPLNGIELATAPDSKPPIWEEGWFELKSDASDIDTTEDPAKALEKEGRSDATEDGAEKALDATGGSTGRPLADSDADLAKLPAGRPKAMNSASPTLLEVAESSVTANNIEVVVMAVKLTDVALPSLYRDPTCTIVPSLKVKVPAVI